MPALQVKDCPDKTYELLRECSARENRSISQQTLTIIEQYLGLRAPETAPRSEIAHLAPAAAGKKTEIAELSFLARRRRTLERINKLPSFDLPEGFDGTADLIAAAREERW
jgi:hypothetical protein